MTVSVAQRLLQAAQAPFSEAAHVMWLALLAQSLESLRDPACVRLLGPLVPGATMAGGARVPGTSYDLGPAQAAFNTSLLLEWASAEAASLLPAERPGQLLGALLAVADYRSRRALAYGAPPWTVGQLTTLLSNVTALRAAPPFAAAGSPLSPPSPLVHLRAACAVGAALLCDAEEQQCRAALQLAGIATHPLEPESPALRPLLTADAAAQGVRLGLLAMRMGDAVGPMSHPWQAALSSVLSPIEQPMPGIAEPQVGQVAAQRFESAVTLHFPVVQADRIKQTLTDRERLAALGVQELLALLMRN